MIVFATYPKARYYIPNKEQIKRDERYLQLMKEVIDIQRKMYQYSLEAKHGDTN